MSRLEEQQEILLNMMNKIRNNKAIFMLYKINYEIINKEYKL